jgi:hypothetical protein
VTMINPSSEYRSMSVAEILDNLAIQIYEPPLSKLREDLRSIPKALRIPILIIDFDTEVHMNGILGFLENSTGLYLADTIDALETIAAHDTAETLRAIHRIMSEHGVTVQRLRSDFADATEFEITSFRELHGEELSQMADLIVRESKKLYVYDRGAERVFDLLSAFLDCRRDEFLASLETSPASG